MAIELPLNEVIGKLNALPEAMEKEFLQVGGKLRTIALLSKEITLSSDCLINIMVDGSLNRSMDELKQVLNSCGVNAAGNRTADVDIHQHMRDLEASLQEAGRQIYELQKRNSSLRNLSLLTRITSHSSGIKMQDFDTVSDNIKSLGSLINDKTSTVLSGLNRLSKSIRDAASRILVLQEKKRGLGEQEIRGISQSMELLARAHEQCGAFSSLISAQSAETTGNIGGVVTSIQYHDITRQKMEHAGAALENVYDRRRANSETTVRAGQDKEIGDLCELQVAQLQLVHQEITQAIQTMGSNLKTISAASSRTEASADQLSGIAREINQSYFSGVENDLVVTISAYAADVEAEEELSLLMQSVVETTAEIASFLDGIEAIGEEIKLIALNAMIKALQLNQEGAGMNVIALAVKAESGLICEQTAAISDSFQQANARAEQLRSRVAQVHEDRVIAQEQLSIHLQTNLMEIQQRNQAITEKIAVVHASSGKLRELVEDALRFVTATTLPQALAKDIIPALKSVTAELRSQQAAVTGKSKEGLMLGKLRETYTMKLERDVFDKYLDAGEVTKGKVIPFQKREIAVQQQTFDEEHLGQNVELF